LKLIYRLNKNLTNSLNAWLALGVLLISATITLIQVVPPEKEGTTATPVKESFLDGIESWCCFEERFFSRTFFRAEHQLDKCLKSLLTLMDSCMVYTYKGRDVLINVPNVERKILANTQPVVSLFKTLKKRGKESNDFNLLEFCVENKIPLDTINGHYPMIFKDYRRIAHSLRLSWAFYLTLQMKDYGKFSFPQRTRNGSFVRKNKNHLSEIFIHIYTSLKKGGINEEKDIVKCLKNSLCFHVSISMDQSELPEGKRIDLVPNQFRGFFKSLKEEERVNFFFSLLQSKVLCQEVPESFVQEALKTHREQLSSEHPGVSKEALKDLYQRGLDFGRLVKKFYDPNKGFYPTNKATFSFPRDKGGVKGDLVYHDRLSTSVNSSIEKTDRMEPFVIGLFGQPGQGKSSMIPKIISALRFQFPGLPFSDLTYERTCNVEHWDGYRGQPIVILDDLGQSKDGGDIKEFQTLVSCNPYILPMADLTEKGTYFTSPIIIVTSNLRYGEQLSVIYTESSGILDDASFWRRIHFPIYIEDHECHLLNEKPSWIRRNNLLFHEETVRKISKRCKTSRDGTPIKTESFFQQVPDFREGRTIWDDYIQNKFGLSVDKEELLKDVLLEFKYRKKYHENIRKTWIQTIMTTSDSTETIIGRDLFINEFKDQIPESLGFSGFKQSDSNSFHLSYNAYPPSNPLPVRVEPIREPLKVRTITAGAGETFCLKPFQRAMWLALGIEPQFCLTHGTNRLETAIERIYNQSNSEDVWISGDYSAATDSFSIEASKALLEGILESIDHEPTKRWAMKEISPHLLVYPKSSGLEPVLQKSGQLMGSLLSFPLLCLLNDCTAKSIGLSPEKYLINGDDILMRTKASDYPIWKERVQDYGLSLSLGKNYIHKRYGTVNSQLILDGQVLNSGKQRVLDRRSQVLGECLRDLELNMGDKSPTEVQELFKSINRKKLSKTVRSIHVPLTHGGLAFSWGERDQTAQTKRTEMLVYLHDLFKKIEPKKGCIAIPYLSVEKLVDEKSKTYEDTFFEFVESDEYHEDFVSKAALPFVKKRVMNNVNLRDLFLGQSIENLPPLNFLSCLQVPFSDEKNRKLIQHIIDQSFLSLFLNGNEEFSYGLFRKIFLGKMMSLNVETEVSRKYLLNFCDLNIQPDFLNKIPVNYKPREFDSKVFISGVETLFEPKKFDLPDHPEAEDFSIEVVNDFNNRLQVIGESHERYLGIQDQLSKSGFLDELRERFSPLN